MPPIQDFRQLPPNEFVGYRIRPDHLNWTVVIVKRRGAASARAGEEYDADVLGYYGRLPQAVKAIIEHEARDQRRLGQSKAAEYALTLKAMEAAHQAALEAVGALVDSWKATGLDEIQARKLLLQAQRGAAESTATSD